jgi:hypothetical protein
MKDKIMELLTKESTWNKLYNGIGFVATGGLAILDPKIAGFVGAGFIALTSPVGKGIAKAINHFTADYEKTETKLDDIAHAASESLLKK